ncbi:hypothetical protein COV25_04185 [candidate division WWE3 bacterium CG10_big_fil_rev_8_21_14_0_10_35_32]|nr:MAG: hypothetical protein COV25_04185 [candidate division WWE3 bacterium CG10_big_fil_rev_8_21_14_0_10_35_32]
MKNLNPLTGLKQISNGYICVSRKMMIDLVRGRILKPSELGFYIMLVISADWDSDQYRKGYIRHEIPKLAKIWRIPYSTLHGYIKKFEEHGLISVKMKAPFIINFNDFTSSGAKEFAKNKTDNEYLNSILSSTNSDFEITENNGDLPNNGKEGDYHFRDAFKEDIGEQDLTDNEIEDILKDIDKCDLKL